MAKHSESPPDTLSRKQWKLVAIVVYNHMSLIIDAQFSNIVSKVCHQKKLSCVHFMVNLLWWIKTKTLTSIQRPGLRLTTRQLANGEYVHGSGEWRLLICSPVWPVYFFYMKYKQSMWIKHSHVTYQRKANQIFNLVCLIAFCFVAVTIFDIKN